MGFPQNITTSQLKSLTPVLPFPRKPRAWPAGDCWGRSPGAEIRRQDGGFAAGRGQNSGGGGKAFFANNSALQQAIETGFGGLRGGGRALSADTRLDSGRGGVGPRQAQKRSRVPASPGVGWVPSLPPPPRLDGLLSAPGGTGRGPWRGAAAPPRPGAALGRNGPRPITFGRHLPLPPRASPGVPVVPGAR